MSFNKSNKEEYHELRPRFKLYSDLDVAKVKSIICSKASQDSTVSCQPISHRIHIKIPEAERHYWSPELQIAIEIPDFEEKTQIRCLIGPAPKIWTMFVFVYFLLGILTFFSGIFGLVQLSLGKSSAWFFLSGLGLLGLLIVFLIVYFGKKQGHEQMIHLIRFVYEALGEDRIVSRG